MGVLGVVKGRAGDLARGGREEDYSVLGIWGYNFWGSSRMDNGLLDEDVRYCVGFGVYRKSED